MGTKINTHHSTQHSPIIDDLIEHAPLYDFIAATRLLRAWLTQQQLPVVWPQLQFLANLSLAFTNADVQKVEQNAQQQFSLVANFSAIYGTASPLPNYYTEALLNDMNQDNPVTRDFLNIFQQRLYESYYEQYSSIQLNAATEKSRYYLQKIYALAGLGNGEIHSNIPSKKLLCYASLLSSQQRTYYGLAHLLSDYCQATVEIEPFYLTSRSIPVEQQVFLGLKNCCLGEDSHIGQSYNSARNNLNIRFSQLSATTFQQLLPKQSLALEVKELIQMYVLQSVHVRLELQGQFTPLTANEAALVLGQNSWLGQPIADVSIAYPLF